MYQIDITDYVKLDKRSEILIFYYVIFLQINLRKIT